MKSFWSSFGVFRSGSGPRTWNSRMPWDTTVPIAQHMNKPGTGTCFTNKITIEFILRKTRLLVISFPPLRSTILLKPYQHIHENCCLNQSNLKYNQGNFRHTWTYVIFCRIGVLVSDQQQFTMPAVEPRNYGAMTQKNKHNLWRFDTTFKILVLQYFRGKGSTSVAQIWSCSVPSLVLKFIIVQVLESAAMHKNPTWQESGVGNVVWPNYFDRDRRVRDSVFRFRWLRPARANNCHNHTHCHFFGSPWVNQ